MRGKQEGKFTLTLAKMCIPAWRRKGLLVIKFIFYRIVYKLLFTSRFPSHSWARKAPRVAYKRQKDSRCTKRHGTQGKKDVKGEGKGKLWQQFFKLQLIKGPAGTETTQAVWWNGCHSVRGGSSVLQPDGTVIAKWKEESLRRYYKWPL